MGSVKEGAAVATDAPQSPLGLFGTDELIAEEDRTIRETVRRFADDRIRPHLIDWYETGSIPARELAQELGKLGVLGMHLHGYGCAGTTATAYGLACLELEAADSGLRSLVSVQGSLAMYAIWRWGSEEQKQQWLPRMAAGEAIGCFGLTEPDFGSNPAGMRTYARRDGDDWVLNGTKMWITNGSVADVAVVWAQTDEKIRGFLVPTDVPGFAAPEIKKKLSLRASVTSELEIFDKPLAAYQATQLKLADMTLELGKGMLLALHLGRLKDAGQLRPEQVSLGKLNNVREALGIARECRTLLGANGVTLEYPV